MLCEAAARSAASRSATWPRSAATCATPRRAPTPRCRCWCSEPGSACGAPRGARELPIEEFFVGPGQTVARARRAPDGHRARPTSARQHGRASSRRGACAWISSLASVAMLLEMDGRDLRRVRAWLPARWRPSRCGCARSRRVLEGQASRPSSWPRRAPLREARGHADHRRARHGAITDGMIGGLFVRAADRLLGGATHEDRDCSFI